MKTELLGSPSDLVVAFKDTGLDRLDFVYTAVQLIDALLNRTRINVVYVNWYSGVSERDGGVAFRIVDAGKRCYTSKAYFTVRPEHPVGTYPTCEIEGTHYFLYPTLEETSEAISYVSGMMLRTDFIKLVWDCSIATKDRNRFEDECFPWLCTVTRRNIKLHNVTWDHAKLQTLKSKLVSELGDLLPF